MFKFVIMGAAVFMLIAWLGGGRVLKLPTWRLGSAMLSLGAFAVAAFFLLRNEWPLSVMLGVVGTWLAVSARFPRAGAGPRARPGSRPPPRDAMSQSQARSMLGVADGATKAEIKAAYARLIQRVHPDKGGAEGLAAQLNAARDRLLKG